MERCLDSMLNKYDKFEGTLQLTFSVPAGKPSPVKGTCLVGRRAGVALLRPQPKPVAATGLDANLVAQLQNLQTLLLENKLDFSNLAPKKKRRTGEIRQGSGLRLRRRRRRAARSSTSASVQQSAHITHIGLTAAVSFAK
ncbi:Hypothetical protein NTJ_13942 [Nesidiocoris tenuis]|uniref:Uncharacterized protein n=1 Tax=Nesidiocoris tenuis TaxID=355587 RepID=A0ABN7B9T5_9HEMI|nr:Hypothetical protein NTJ_13942 [Nesidiocoris tenuis]